MTHRWTTPTERNRLRIAAVLAFGALGNLVFATITTPASITGILSTMVAWIVSGMVLFSAWMWLYGFGDRWRFPLDVTGALIIAASVAVALMQEPPRTLLLLPFYVVARTLAVKWEQNRIAVWEQNQRDRRATGRPVSLRDDPLISERDRTRRSDAHTEYPATLRELRARLRRSEGDPWS